MTNATIRWGLVGTGGYARRACAPAVSQAHGATLAGAASSERSRAQALAVEFGAELATSSVEDLCAGAAVDAVWIASPSAMHLEHGRIALEAGKHVLMEKPLALDADGARSLVDLAAARGVVLATGYQARYVPAHRRMQALIADGAIGTPVVARTYYGNRRPGGPNGWRAQRITARWGALADIGTHHLDLLRMLVAEVTQVSGCVGHQLGFETEDTAVASLAFASGAVGSLTATHAAPVSTTLVEVVGTEGTLRAVDTSPTGQGRAWLRRGDGSEEDITGETPSSLVAQLETLGRAIAGEDVAYASGADGARNVELLERIAP
jgi:predicted dehydrogenase